MILASATAIAIGPAAAQPATQTVLSELMRELSEVKSARGKFVERKYLTMLSGPLESSGTLVYVAPGRLEKHMLAPRKESLILDGDTLLIENKDTARRRTFALQEHPVIWAFVESIRSTLTGDLATLERLYEVSLEGDARAWRLQLKPRQPRMRQAASEITLSGAGAWVHTIEILEAGGDRSVTMITRDSS